MIPAPGLAEAIDNSVASAHNESVLKGTDMAVNTEKEHRAGAVKDRVQIQNPVTKQWIKIDTTNGRIVDSKKTPGPFKGVAKKSK